MSSTAVGAVVDGVVLVALWVAVLVRRVPRAARLPLAVTAFACAWGLCYVILTSRFAKWTILPAGFAIVTSLSLLVVAAHLSLPHDGGEGGGEDGGGGLDKPPPDRPNDGGDLAEPDWWPEFERDLARYRAERERGRRPAVGRSSDAIQGVRMPNDRCVGSGDRRLRQQRE